AGKRRSRLRRRRDLSTRRPPRRCRSPVDAAASRSTCRRAAGPSRSCAPRAARPRSSPERRKVHRRTTAFPAALGRQDMGDVDDLLKAAQKNDLAKATAILDRHPSLLRMKTPNGTLVLTATFYGAADAVKSLLARTPEYALNLYEAATVANERRLRTSLGHARDRLTD